MGPLYSTLLYSENLKVTRMQSKSRTMIDP
jgi:hypothetical protein